MKRKLYILALAAGSTLCANADRVLYFPLDGNSPSLLNEKVSGSNLAYHSNFGADYIPGVAGKCLRLDGYSSYASGTVSMPDAPEQMTVSVWVAPETYPVIEADRDTQEKALIAGTINEPARQGWGFHLGKTGKYNFAFYAGGWKMTLEASDLLPCGEWSNLCAVMDSKNNVSKLYRNGKEVATGKCQYAPVNKAKTLYIGKGQDQKFVDCFFSNTINGAIDELEVFDNILADSEIAKLKTTETPQFGNVANRFDNDKLRPKFHGMPAANWTNECHGMTYSNGKYHLFFQKNGNGPYMTRLHWGHISSADLCVWQEEKVAIYPDAAYDIKGCWSGCVFTDQELTGSRPGAIYTAVDYGRATIAYASPVDDDLIQWKKPSPNPWINGVPSGMGDDFRDPYFFRNGSNAYIIVGTSKDDKGAVTLHKYNPATKTFSNDGKLFFQANSNALEGRFWEMPNITDMGGNWLFTVTPLDATKGVFCGYYPGSINSDGTFQLATGVSHSPTPVEIFARDGYGLLSPTIYKKDGKTIALGIVPDKLGGGDNHKLGWAHCYSLPREWSMNGNALVQKPFSGLEALRSNVKYSKDAFTLNGTESLNPVNGRQFEVLCEFTAGAQPLELHFFKGATGQAKLTLQPLGNSGSLTLDFTGLQRLDNDGWSYKGKYTNTISGLAKNGETIKLNMYVDGSILDIFINDKFATSVRVFPTAQDADGVEVAGAGVEIKNLKAWNLAAQTSGIDNAIGDNAEESDPSKRTDFYNVSGVAVLSNATHAEATQTLPAGIYIANGKKFLVK